MLYVECFDGLFSIDFVSAIFCFNLSISDDCMQFLWCDQWSVGSVGLP